MIEQLYKDVYDEELAKGAIINDRHPGFVEDYMVLHILLRKHNPKSVFEIGTHTGFGTMIIKNAVPEATVYTLDLPDDIFYKSLQHPISEGKRGGVGHECLLPFTQLWGDSTTFDFSQYPCAAYFCDAEHSEENVFKETVAMVSCNPELIVYHDADAPEVMAGMLRGLRSDYILYRVVDTRIAYAVKKLTNELKN